MSDEALEIGLELVLLLKANVVDELHVCRKNYLDGSVPCGFQRTLIIGLNGSIPVNGKEVPIETICIEEDAARKIREERNTVYYRLDRLGIPLVEIVTAPCIETPEELMEAAFRIGLLLRSTGKVRRGIGTIRQDVNVSVRDGARVEIKGVQKLEWLPKLARNEVIRQLSLIRIKDELARRGVREEDLKLDVKDVTEVFRKTRSRLLKQRGDERVLAVRLPKFSGILGIEVQPGKRFGKEIAEKVHAVTGLAGIIHSDENLEEYGISAEEISELRLTLGVNEGDAFVLVKAPRETGERALEIVVERARQSLRGVPNETRRALENGNSEFLRELHGGARLYPDTDTPPIRLNPELIDSVARKLPEYPWNIKDKLVKEYGISEEFAEKLILEGKVFLFREIVDEYRVDPVFVASVLLQTLKALEREGVKVEEVTEEELKEVFRQLSENRIAKEAIEPLIAKLAEKRISVEEALKELGISPLSERELEELVGSIVSENIDIVKERGERAFSPLMGMIMKQVRGRIDGSKVAEVLKRKIREGAGG
ncbi:MAG: Glu-tRNA(Gln) amidotransferase subunit GatE [Candidatus Freyarchaeota archaeon]|nr:Glu-tRNA(Gln) amidotransferase subunit GatE [Candidatus Jordarchaeia archaeon]